MASPANPPHETPNPPQAPSGAAPSPTTGELVDIPIDLIRVHHVRWYWVALWVPLGVVVVPLLLVLVYKFSEFAPLLLLVGAVGLVTLMGWSAGRARRRVEELLSKWGGVRSNAVIAEVLALADPLYMRGVPITVRTVVRRLAKVRPGAAVRALPPELLYEIPPFDVTFEPRLLDERELVCDELLADQVERDEGSLRQGSWKDEDPEWRNFRRRLNASVAKRGGAGTIAWATFAAAYAAYVGFRDWDITTGVFVLGFFALSIALRPFLHGRWSRIQWFVIPDGIVVRTSGPFAGEVVSRVFTRTRAALCLYGAQTGQWGLYVSAGRESAFATVTLREGEFALRAWLSPVDPPPIARLQEVFPGARVVGAAAPG
ncbi:MAG: hypothetical protein HY763_05425 [Planctomycetes bacterium]|nr:hypothetical protein [Planctomycetota bacterium]